MSTNETVSVSTQREPESVLKGFFAGVGMQVETELLDTDRFYACVAGIKAYCWKFSAPAQIDAWLTNNLGFKVAVKLALFYDKESEWYQAGDHETVRTTMIRATLALLMTYKEPMVLEFEFGGVVPRYIQEKLTLYASLGVWTEERLKLVDMPYTMEKGFTIKL